MPCSQMMRMNCNPPRAMADVKLTMLPAVKALILNSFMSIIGSVTRFSIMTKATSSATPRTTPESTIGLDQPMLWPPYGCSP